MRQIGLIHTDTRILYCQLIGSLICASASLLLERQANAAASLRILNGIADNVQHDFPKLRPVAQHQLLLDIHQRLITQALLFYLRLKNRIQRLHNLTEIHSLLIQHCFAAFYTRHFQNLIDNHEQQIAGRLDFADIFPTLFDIRKIFAQQMRKADNRVHRRADIMAHVKKKARFRRIRHPRFLRRALNPFGIQPFLIPLQLQLIKNNRDKKRYQKRDKARQHFLSARNPAVLRRQLQIPGIVRHSKGHLHRIIRQTAAALRNNNLLVATGYALAHPIGKAGITQLIQAAFFDKAAPVND